MTEPAMTFRDFHNLLRILCNIDRWDLPRVFADPGDWFDFQENPWRWFIRAPDAKAEAVWDVALARHSKKES